MSSKKRRSECTLEFRLGRLAFQIAAGSVSTLVAMRDGVAPPTINLDDPDLECDLGLHSERSETKRLRVRAVEFTEGKNSALVLQKI